MDTVSAKRRSEIMSLVRGKDTGPERVVRRIVFGMGRRYRLHVSGLQGKPDLVLQRDRKVIFVHGCFWHMHEKCALARIPKSRVNFWREKLEANRERDSINMRSLRSDGWRVLVIWECQLRDLENAAANIETFLHA